MSNKISSVLWKVFLVVYSMAMAAVIALCVMETQENVSATLMIIYPLVGIFVVSGIAYLGIKVEPFLDKYEKYLLPIFFVCYTIITVRMTLHSRGVPVHDSASLVEGSYYMAGLTEEMNWTYFARWNHQVAPMVLLSFVFRIATWLHIPDVYYLALACNIIQVLCALYCVYKLGKKYSAHGSVSGWLGMCMMSVYIPIWGHTQSLYTDAFSFCFGIVAFYIWLCNYEKRKTGWKYWLINVLAGMIWALGYEIKATAAISLVAVLIYLFLFDKWKMLFKHAVCLILPVIAAIFIGKSYVQTLPCMEYEDSWGVPAIEYFIGLGLEADGSFRLDSEFFNTIAGGIWGMENKKAYGREFIKENISQLWNKEHVVAKLRHNFASGKMKADDFMQICDNHGFLYNCVSSQGAYRRPYRTIITAYWYMLLEFILIACVLRTFAQKKEADKEHAAVVVPILSVCGIMLYVMLFEANNRQLYNHIPMVFCAANAGIWALYAKVELVFAKYKTKKMAAD